MKRAGQIFCLAIVSIGTSASAAPPKPLYTSQGEINAIVESMPNLDDAIIGFTTDLDGNYTVQVLRTGTVCLLKFNVAAKHGPLPDQVTYSARAIAVEGKQPICR
jgi:hypothetical protein